MSDAAGYVTDGRYFGDLTIATEDGLEDGCHNIVRV
jgi:hypothetical protein